MSKCEALRAKAQNNPNGLRFTELCALAECFGWVLDRTRGSHCVYKRAGEMRAMVFQNFKGSAKPYQVNQLLKAIDSLPDESDKE
ncbi:MAG: type II toxin-antitoxin system HicA family toxin [Gemmatimonadaceae bacterium]|nr:type II toxin-antitoxin system HicA family toxin [Gemmatimonadaceae bacterium]